MFCLFYLLEWRKKILARGEGVSIFLIFSDNIGQYIGVWSTSYLKFLLLQLQQQKWGLKSKIQIVTNSKPSLWLNTKSKFLKILIKRYGPLRRPTSSFNLQPRLFWAKKRAYFSVLAHFLQFVVASSNLGNF